MFFLRGINAKLRGAPDQVLTVVLIAVGILALVIAIKGNPAAKAFVAAWLIAP